MPAPSVRIDCRFYRTSVGREPVREWLRGLSPDERKEIGSDIRRVQWRWPIGKPLADGLGRGLYEVRTAHRGGSYRVLFCIQGGTMVLLHGFKKKTPATPWGDLALARDRQRDVADVR